MLGLAVFGVVTFFICAMCAVALRPPPVDRICAEDPRLQRFSGRAGSPGTMQGVYRGHYIEFLVDEGRRGGQDDSGDRPPGIAVKVSLSRVQCLRAMFRTPPTYGGWDWPSQAREEQRAIQNTPAFVLQSLDAALDSAWTFEGAPNATIASLLQSPALLAELRALHAAQGMTLTFRNKKLILWRLCSTDEAATIITTLNMTLRFAALIEDELTTYITASARRELDQLSELQQTRNANQSAEYGRGSRELFTFK